MPPKKKKRMDVLTATAAAADAAAAPADAAAAPLIEPYFGAIGEWGSHRPGSKSSSIARV